MAHNDGGIGDSPEVGIVTAFTPAVQPPMPGEKCQTCGHKAPEAVPERTEPVVDTEEGEKLRPSGWGSA